MQLALVISLVGLLLVAAAGTVMAEDRREQRRHAQQRHARLAALGEVDSLAHVRVRGRLIDRWFG